MMRMLLAGETLAYGAQTILSGVRFSLAEGERVVLLGKSGAGKTTLLNAIHDRLVDRGSRVALVPQDHCLVPQLSVLRNALMGRLDDHGPVYNLSNFVRPRIRDRVGVRAVLEELRLAAEIDRTVEGLSGGQKQRVALARAFWRGGEVIIGDEPVSALDEIQGREVLRGIASRFGQAVLALHDVQLALSFATRIIGLKGGHIVFDDEPADIELRQIGDLYA